jgi:hypothetical protein
LKTGKAECYAIWRFHRHEQESHVFFKEKRQRCEEDDHSAAAATATAAKTAVHRRKRKKTKRGTKEKGKVTAVKKVKN